MSEKSPESLKISIVVPLYNAKRTLKKCLEALNRQTDHNYEVIVVNDGSKDDSLEICKEFDFKVLNLPMNKGQAVARNTGVKESSGELIAFIDADAVPPHDWIEKYRSLLAKYLNADMMCSGYSLNPDDSQAAHFAFYESQYRRLKIPLYINSTTSSNCVVYKQSFREVGGYPEYYINPRRDKKAVATNEDSELGFLLTKKGKKIVWSHDNPVTHYFRQTWRGYLKQQIAFARYAILSIFKFPGMLKHEDIYNSEKMVPQLIAASIMILGILGVFFGKIGIAITILIEMSGILCFYGFHRAFLQYLKENMSDYSFRKIFFWLVLSRICLVYGVVLGVKDGLLLLFNHERTSS